MVFRPSSRWTKKFRGCFSARVRFFIFHRFAEHHEFSEFLKKLMFKGITGQ
jgi:hypothetical protein